MIRVVLAAASLVGRACPLRGDQSGLPLGLNIWTISHEVLDSRVQQEKEYHNYLRNAVSHFSDPYFQSVLIEGRLVPRK